MTANDTVAATEVGTEVETTGPDGRDGTVGADGLDAPWTVLVDRDETAAVERPASLRRVVAPVAIAAVIVVAVVAVTGGVVSHRIAQDQAVHDVTQLTDVIAETAIRPALTDRMLTDPAQARAVLDPIVRDHVVSASLTRVKLWTPGGTVLYSDEPALIGRTFALEDEARAALVGHRTEADVSDLARPENRFERSQGTLLEVYRPVWTPSGRPLLFEAYYRYGAVSTRSSQLWRGFGGVMLSCLLALLLLLVPIAWALASRSRRARRQREELMQHALDASDEERRRIAAALHDGVVQQLAAASFTAAGGAERALASGERQLAAEIDTVAGTVRDGIAGLRSLLVDIYPPNLHSSGLAPALRDLARTSTAAEASVDTEVDGERADALPTDTQQAVFRVAQEALRNAVRHSGAARVAIRLRADGDRVVLDVVDDGRGFDVATAGAEGHFGLELMTDQARRAHGRLAVASAPGRGTTVRLEVGAR